METENIKAFAYSIIKECDEHEKTGVYKEYIQPHEMNKITFTNLGWFEYYFSEASDKEIKKVMSKIVNILSANREERVRYLYDFACDHYVIDEIINNYERGYSINDALNIIAGHESFDEWLRREKPIVMTRGSVTYPIIMLVIVPTIVSLEKEDIATLKIMRNNKNN